MYSKNKALSVDWRCVWVGKEGKKRGRKRERMRLRFLVHFTDSE